MHYYSQKGLQATAFSQQENIAVRSQAKKTQLKKTMKKKKSWEPATTWKVKKLKRAGPKEGQSVKAYLHWKTKGRNYESPNELTNRDTTY